jgi:hypothetical protein
LLVFFRQKWYTNNSENVKFGGVKQGDNTLTTAVKFKYEK